MTAITCPNGKGFDVEFLESTITMSPTFIGAVQA